MCNFQISQVPQSNPDMLAERPACCLWISRARKDRCQAADRHCVEVVDGSVEVVDRSVEVVGGSVEVVDAANSCRLCGRPPNGFPLVFPGGHWRV